MTDPLLGLRFDSGIVKYEAASPVILRDLKLRPGDYWVFAKVTLSEYPNRQYILISGLAKVELDSLPPSDGPLEPDFGTLAVSEDGHYRIIGPADSLFALPDSVATAIIRDAIQRSIRAFGGVDALERQIRNQITHDVIPRVLADVLISSGVPVDAQLVAE